MIEILYYEKVVKESSKVIGLVDIKFPMKDMQGNLVPMIFRKVAHLQSGEKRWFNLANFKRPKGNGQDAYLPYAQPEQSSHITNILEHLPKLVEKYIELNDHLIAITKTSTKPFSFEHNTVPTGAKPTPFENKTNNSDEYSRSKDEDGELPF